MNKYPFFLTTLFLFFGLANIFSQEITLSNDSVMVKLDLNSGGAISYISEANTNYNIVNIRDKGRYIQQSYYAGQDLNRIPNGQHSSWSPWPWNPIQAGDVFDHEPEILDYHQTTEELYVKSIPMLWDMNDQPAEAVFEIWVQLKNNVIQVKNKVTINRTDNVWTQIIPKHQELPAVYTIADLQNLYTYIGSKPFQNEALTEINNSAPPWEYWNTHENWAAFVNNNNWGLGVLNKACNLFVGGFSGTPGGGATHVSTGYMSPLITLALGPNEVFEYDYELILGTLDEIRNYVYENNELNQTTHWEFNTLNDREGWEMAGGISALNTNGNSLEITINGADPFIYNLNTVIDPTEYTRLAVRLKNNTNDNFLQMFWQNDNGSLAPERSASINTVINDGLFTEYIFDLLTVDEWTNGGLISGLRIDPPGNGIVEESVEIDYIHLLKDVCYLPATLSTIENPALEGAVGITSLNRFEAKDNWVNQKSGAYLVLESKNKGLVINRLTQQEIDRIPTLELVEGMVTFDTTNDCLKIYDGISWKCYNTAGCP